MKMLILISMVIHLNVFAHGDHSVPGVLPPAPNGGVLSEAKHDHKDSGKHNHKVANEKELFFEAKYKKNKIAIFPLLLSHKEKNVFSPIKVSEIKDLKIKLKNPRTKQLTNFTLVREDESIGLEIESTRIRRLIIELSALIKQARYTAEIQVEKL